VDVQDRDGDFADSGLLSRVLACALALVLGAFAGITLTAVHQATLSTAAMSLPWGIVVALVITAALLTGLRLVFESRLVALAAAIGLLAASALLASASTGGSVLVPANTAGYAWTFGPVLIAVVTLAWPRLGAARQR
jgi:N-acetyl-1-D-myo-inositol-2-amino-2-deoxy-alpha-D-glucopyranoside deacetylase